MSFHIYQMANMKMLNNASDEKRWSWGEPHMAGGSVNGSNLHLRGQFGNINKVEDTNSEFLKFYS